jgi:cytochrome P450
MVARRRPALTDDLISELIRAEDDGDRLSADELRMLAAGLLIAGTDTTRNQLAGSVDVLCDYPDAGGEYRCGQP